jgi:hypothetical protein
MIYREQFRMKGKRYGLQYIRTNMGNEMSDINSVKDLLLMTKY